VSSEPGFTGLPPAQPTAQQPMSINSVIRIAARIMRKHWAVLLGVAVLLIGPAALLSAATQTRFNTVALDVFPGISEGLLDTSAIITAAEFERLAGAFGVYLLAIALAGVLGTIALLGFSAVVSADYHGRSIKLGSALRTCLHRGLSVLGVVLVTSLIIVGVIVVGVALIVTALSALSGGSATQGGPGAFVAIVIGVSLVIVVVYLTTRWALAIPVLAVEDRGWREGLTRSWHLSGDNVWRTFAVIVLASVATFVIGLLLSNVLTIVLVGVLATTLGLDDTIAQTLSLALGAILLAPLAATFIAVLYFDLRVRRDPPADSRPSTD
jgi:hypothetical protein